MHFTVLVLYAMAFQLVLGFVAALFTSGIQAVYWRRKILGALWAITGFVLIGAIITDLYFMLR